MIDPLTGWSTAGTSSDTFLPVHSYHNTRYFGVPTNPQRTYRDELPLWEQTIGIWENQERDLVGVVHSENEEPGEAFIQIHPDYTMLYNEMVTYIETHLADRVGNIGYVKLYIYDDNRPLQEIAMARGYRQLASTPVFEYRIRDVPEVPLPKGFRIHSVLDEDDVEQRRKVNSIAFGSHYAPSAWSPASAFQMMQQAPDYRKDLDLFVVAPNGEYASFCTVWIDVKNRYGNFEPVGTHVEYRRMGLARAVMLEGFRRMRRYGVTRSFMDSTNAFYPAIGFRKTPYSYSPWIKYFIV
jgi:predicted N-acetyltransferase YhbS